MSSQKYAGVVIVQTVLLICVSTAPVIEQRYWGYQGCWHFQDNVLLLIVGVILIALGALVIGIATHFDLDLHSPFRTLFPQPLEGKYLVTTGIYRHIRHPQSAGYLIGSLGYLLVMDGYRSLILWPICVVFLLFEIRLEERLLKQTYPEYREYKERTKHLIPFVW